MWAWPIPAGQWLPGPARTGDRKGRVQEAPSPWPEMSDPRTWAASKGHRAPQGPAAPLCAGPSAPAGGGPWRQSCCRPGRSHIADEDQRALRFILILETRKHMRRG